jgi:nucleotide-binding universal stress UspA family protein
MHAAAGRDLLVVGRAAHSRFGGIAIGSTASNLAHRARMPLLIATAPPAGVAFPERILVAADGPGHPERAVRAAGLIARSHGSDVTLVRLDWSHRAKGQELAAAVRELTAIGVEPLEIVMGGTPRRQIPALAADERASLVIVGCRGLSGARAIGSTSERVAHQAPCSVLILRPPVPVR